MVEFMHVTLQKWVNDHLKDHKSSFKVAGQLENAQLIVTWCRNSNSDDQKAITYLATADINTGSVQVIVQLEGSLDICHASINYAQTLIAFVVRVKLNNVALSGNEYTYQAFTTSRYPEYQNKNSWLTITDNHSFVIQCHFIRSKRSDYDNGLVVLIHRHSIQVHKINQLDMLHIGSSRVLALDFYWSQWLQDQQCLTFLHKQSSNEQATISCVQFYGRNKHTTVFSIPGSQISLNQIPTSNVQGFQLSINVISSEKLNLCVILWREGSVSICYQPYPPTDHSEKFPSYVIAMLHHGCTVKGTLTTSWTKDIWPITFAAVDYHQILILSPGGPTHIVDADTSHEPSYHIITSEPYWPFNEKNTTTVIPLIDQRTSLLIQCQPFKAASIRLCKEELVTLFQSTRSNANRQSICHYLFAHDNNYSNCNKILKVVKKDPLNMAISSIFQEYLTASTFANVNSTNVNSHSILYHLPLQNISQVKDFFEISFDGQTDLAVDSLLLASTWTRNKSPESSMEVDNEQSDVWHMLWHHQVAIQKRKSLIQRQFSLDNLSANASILSEPTLNSPASSRSSTPTKNRKSPSLSDLCTFCSRNHGSSINVLNSFPEVLNPCNVKLPFPTADDLNKQENIRNLVSRNLQEHLKLCCSTISNSAIIKLGGDYVIAQAHQSQILCSLIFASFGIVHDDSKLPYQFLSELSETKLFALQALLERYLLVCIKLNFPLPSGFENVFAVICFRAMNFLNFMQHVQNKAVTLEKDVVMHLIQDLDNSPESVEKKMYLIGYLPKEDGESILKKWDHSIANKYRSRRRARQVLTLKDKSQPDVHQVCEQNVEKFGVVSTENAEYALAATEID